MDEREEFEEKEEYEEYEEYDEEFEDDEDDREDDWYYEEPAAPESFDEQEYYESESYESEAFDPEEFYEHDPDNEWTVVTQGFYEQYGAEIQRSMKEYSQEDVMEEYEEEDVEERERIFKPKKKRRKKHYLLKFLAFCVVVGMIIGIGLSPIFEIKEIKVEGAANNKSDQIIKSSGVKKGDNIFKVRRSSVEESLKKNAYLSSVDIERKLPGTLTIVVKERTEASFIAYGGDYLILDSRGYILRRAEKKPKLTELTNVKITDMNIGEQIGVKDSETFEKCLEIISSMGTADLFFKKISVKGVMVRAYIKDNFLCKGKAENLMKNMENGNIKSILRDLRKKGKKKGTIIITDDKYCSYSPKVE